MTTDERERRIRALLPLVRSIARRVHRMVPMTDVDDLIGDGCVGLIRAVDAFDPARGVPLEHYARRVVLGAVLNGIRRMDPVSERMRRTMRSREGGALHAGANGRHAAGIRATSNAARRTSRPRARKYIGVRRSRSTRRCRSANGCISTRRDDPQTDRRHASGARTHARGDRARSTRASATSCSRTTSASSACASWSSRSASRRSGSRNCTCTRSSACANRSAQAREADGAAGVGPARARPIAAVVLERRRVARGRAGAVTARSSFVAARRRLDLGAHARDHRIAAARRRPRAVVLAPRSANDRGRRTSARDRSQRIVPAALSEPRAA